MSRPRVPGIAIDAFYDSFTCTALFRRLRIPGSPEEIVDPRPVRTFWSDEFRQILAEQVDRLHVVTRVAMVGVMISALRKSDPKDLGRHESERLGGVMISALLKSDPKGSSAGVEDIEGFLADLPTFIKP